jgi:hypothetical protein
MEYFVRFWTGREYTSTDWIGEGGIACAGSANVTQATPAPPVMP